MTRVLVTGSTTGLGLGAARHLLDAGHEVVLHARTPERAEELHADPSLGSTGRVAGIVVGDVGALAGVRRVADEASAIGGLDAVIHNAALFVDRTRVETPDGHARTFATNVVAPYLLTARIAGPTRLVYLSSGMHLDGDPSLDDLDWRSRPWDGTQAYCDSKLHVTALAFALARHRPGVLAHAVDPGWVPTRMGGPGAPDDLVLGHVTQAWLAVTDESDPCSAPGYWHHQERRTPHPATLDGSFQDGLLARLGELTGEPLG